MHSQTTKNPGQGCPGFFAACGKLLKKKLLAVYFSCFYESGIRKSRRGGGYGFAL
jgi:hypothetical protein